ncbi:hypothetical protein OG413_12520 [Streptomyces sp. NBC_01433]|uniref:hypothetical protein n=1 Tax=Streptomyces sp. NBC_01433 TaxID=2903864 RepID=UPI00225881C7|nr:hypothetical protein [Streptomyces sp. NBC_01433]MCX4676118.1 hypothetical protein [Streptomyces sp. NBC_01433]
MSGPEGRHETDRTGNGIVNHGPENTPGNDTADDALSDTRDDASGHSSGDEAVDASGDVSGDVVGIDTGGIEAGGDASGAGAGGGLSGGDILGDGTSGRFRGEDAGGDVPGGDVPGTLTDLFAGRARDGGELDEVALRRMLRGAVHDLAPSEGTLDHLHRAVPARRARRRQAVVGAAAAALLIGTAVPAFVHVASSDGSSTDRPAIAGHGEQTQGGNGTDTGSEAGGDLPSRSSERESEGGKGLPDASDSPSVSGGTDAEGNRIGGVADSPRSEAASMPTCDPSQLGVASAGTGATGADGTVYGSFKIANVSGKDCSVSSNGTVSFMASGAADPLKIDVVQHTAGDAASGLPDPSTEPGTVLLKPSMAYEVKFAWVPTDTCPTTGATPSPTPTDGAGGSTGEGSPQEGTQAQLAGEEGGAADGSVAVTHTPESGAPTAETKIDNACAGTIYRTGVLTAS